MDLWRRTVLPAVAAVVATAVLSACANGGGLRVEGPESPPPSPTPSVAFGTRPTPEKTPEVAVDLAKVRVGLLADRHLSSYARTVLSNCTVISRCLSRGKTVDVLHSGTPQQIVLIHTLEKFVFGIFLIATGPRARDRSGTWTSSNRP